VVDHDRRIGLGGPDDVGVLLALLHLQLTAVLPVFVVMLGFNGTCHKASGSFTTWPIFHLK
jgi:hypothetical protein